MKRSGVSWSGLTKGNSVSLNTFWNKRYKRYNHYKRYKRYKRHKRYKRYKQYKRYERYDCSRYPTSQNNNIIIQNYNNNKIK